MTTALGIDVPDELVRQWPGWFAPDRQPFPADRLDEPLAVGRREFDPTAEVRDTFCVYSGDWVWLDEAEFSGLSPRVRRALLDGREATGLLSASPRVCAARRLRPQPTTVARVAAPRGCRTGRRLRRGGPGPEPASAGEWLDLGRMRRGLPAAAELAGTFPPVSGPDCFGTVMAAAGVQGAATGGMVQAPFEDWLAGAATSVTGTGQDHHPGTVLVRRDRDGLQVRAAVTLGDGYVLSKPSQSWYGPGWPGPSRRRSRPPDLPDIGCIAIGCRPTSCGHDRVPGGTDRRSPPAGLRIGRRGSGRSWSVGSADRVRRRAPADRHPSRADPPARSMRIRASQRPQSTASGGIGTVMTNLSAFVSAWMG